MTHLDLFLQKGPTNGDVVAGLEELRRIVLLDGIPSNSDGMVSHVQVRPHSSQLTMSVVRIAHLHLAYPTQRSTYPNESLSRSRRTGRLTSLCQDTRRHVPYIDHRSTVSQKSIREQSHACAERHSMEIARRERGEGEWMDVTTYIGRTAEFGWK